MDRFFLFLIQPKPEPEQRFAAVLGDEWNIFFLGRVKQHTVTGAFKQLSRKFIVIAVGDDMPLKIKVAVTHRPGTVFRNMDKHFQIRRGRKRFFLILSDGLSGQRLIRFFKITIDAHQHPVRHQHDDKDRQRDAHSSSEFTAQFFREHGTHKVN